RWRKRLPRGCASRRPARTRASRDTSPKCSRSGCASRATTRTRCAAFSTANPRASTSRARACRRATKCMSAPIFVDANVFVYARDVDDVVRQPLARSWLEWLWQQELGRTSTQVLSEYYVTATRKLKPGIPEDQAWDDVEALMHWHPQPVDRQTMERARTI